MYNSAMLDPARPRYNELSKSISPLSLFFRRRPFFWLVLSVCGGIFFDSSAHWPPATSALIAAGWLVAAFVSIFIPRLKMSAAARAFGLLCACCAAFSMGAFWHAERFRIPRADDVTRLTPERPCFARLRGLIVEAEWKVPAPDEIGRGKSTHWIVALDALGTDHDSLRPASGRVRLALKDTPASSDVPRFAEGDVIECSAALEPLPEATLPESFDYGEYLRARGVGRIGRTERSGVLFLAPPEWWRAGLLLRRFSGELSLRTREVLNGSDEQAGLLNAMLFGRREYLSNADRDAFAINGTAHLLAISGLHVQLICLAFFHLLGWFGLPRRSSAFWVLGVSVGYCLLTGASPPAIRAAAMLAAYVGADIFWREKDALNALAAAALVVLIISPHELFSAGFQFSFLAVFALITLLPAFEEAWQAWELERSTRRGLSAALEHFDGGNASLPPQAPRFKIVSRWLLNFLRQSCFITLAAWLATAPAVAWHMGRISTVSLFANLLALPLLSCCMFPGLAAVLLGSIWPALGKLVGSIAWFFLALLEKLNAFCAALPGASLDVPRPPLPLLLSFAALLIAIWILRGRLRPVLRLTCLLPAAIGLMFSNVFFFEQPNAPEIWFFDLQRGHSALLTGPQGSALIDAGSFGEGARVAETLRRTGHARLDLLLITADEPAALGGALELARLIAFKRAILPRAKFPSETRRALENFFKSRGIPYDSPKEGEALTGCGALTWRFSSDGPADNLPAANASTLFASIDTGTFKVLIAAAKSSASLERWLAKPNGTLQAGVLRLIPGAQKRWPKECADIIRRAEPAVIVAGNDSAADELPGMDFDGIEAPVYAPGKEGTLKISREPGDAGALRVESYRNGWHRN